MQKYTREFHVYDSFEGLPEKLAQDQSRAGDQFKAGELAITKKQFIVNYKKAGLSLPRIHKGWFNDLTAVDVPEKIAFAFLDGDYYESVLTPLKLIWPRLVPGAAIVVDDYANEALPGAAKAVDEWVATHPARLSIEHSLAILRPTD
jgi:O-methyltransferase